MAAHHLPVPRSPQTERTERTVWAGQWLLAVAIALAAALAAAALVADRDLSRRATEVASGDAPAGTGTRSPATSDRGPGAEGYYDLDGGVPTAFPATPLGVAFLTLDDPFTEAPASLGPPASTFPDIGGTASTWFLGDARLTVGAWGEGDRLTVSSLHVGVPAGSPVRVSAFGAVIGKSTLAEVVAAWGDRYTAATSPYDDYVVSYVECAGPYPVVVKFDQVTATDATFRPGPGSPLWDQPVTSVFVAFADERPGGGGCPAP